MTIGYLTSHRLVWPYESSYYLDYIFRWADHIIKRFGKENAKIFAQTNYHCPCRVFGWHCDDCAFAICLDLCPHAKDWMSLGIDEVYNIKKNILEKLKNEN